MFKVFGRLWREFQARRVLDTEELAVFVDSVDVELFEVVCRRNELTFGMYSALLAKHGSDRVWLEAIVRVLGKSGDVLRENVILGNEHLDDFVDLVLASDWFDCDAWVSWSLVCYSGVFDSNTVVTNKIIELKHADMSDAEFCACVRSGRVSYQLIISVVEAEDIDRLNVLLRYSEISVASVVVGFAYDLLVRMDQALLMSVVEASFAEVVSGDHLERACESYLNCIWYCVVKRCVSYVEAVRFLSNEQVREFSQFGPEHFDVLCGILGVLVREDVSGLPFEWVEQLYLSYEW